MQKYKPGYKLWNYCDPDQDKALPDEYHLNL